MSPVDDQDSLDSSEDSSPWLEAKNRHESSHKLAKRCKESFFEVRLCCHWVSHFLGALNLGMVHHLVHETIEGPSRIAFGSCNDHDHQNNLWPIIESRRPAAFVWGGDAIYAGM